MRVKPTLAALRYTKAQMMQEVPSPDSKATPFPTRRRSSVVSMHDKIWAAKEPPPLLLPYHLCTNMRHRPRWVQAVALCLYQVVICALRKNLVVNWCIHAHTNAHMFSLSPGLST